MYEVQSRLSCRQRVPSRSGSIKGTGERSAGGGRGGAEEELEGVVEVEGRTSGPSFSPGCDPRPEGGQGPAAPIITHYYALHNISEYCPIDRDLFVGLQNICSPSIKYMHCTIYIYTRTTKLATQLRWEILCVLVSSNLPVWKIKSSFYFIYELFELPAT